MYTLVISTFYNLYLYKINDKDQSSTLSTTQIQKRNWENTIIFVLVDELAELLFIL